MNKGYCPFSKVGLYKRLYCNKNNNKLCQYQKYCSKDHCWYNSDKTDQCELKKMEANLD